MIGFFRRIRKQLADDNKPAKYARYAVGEIVLVMVGILLALQVNNWNEVRKEKIQEKKMLVELKKSLEINCLKMERDSINRFYLNMSSEIIISALVEEIPYSDSLNIHFQYARLPDTNLSLSHSGYEGLKNAGLNIISSDGLRNEIVNLFELSYNGLYDSMAYFESFQPNRQIIIDELFMYDDAKFDKSNPTAIPIIPHDYEELMNNKGFLALIKSVKIQRNVIGITIGKNLHSSRRILQLINEELENLN